VQNKIIHEIGPNFSRKRFAGGGERKNVANVAALINLATLLAAANPKDFTSKGEITSLAKMFSWRDYIV
jgi:hypothetical protein